MVTTRPIDASGACCRLGFEGSLTRRWLIKGYSTRSDLPEVAAALPDAAGLRMRARDAIRPCGIGSAQGWLSRVPRTCPRQCKAQTLGARYDQARVTVGMFRTGKFTELAMKHSSCALACRALARSGSPAPIVTFGASVTSVKRIRPSLSAIMPLA